MATLGAVPLQSEHSGVVSGLVTNVTSENLAEVSVTLRPANGVGSTKRTLTDAKGRFVFTGVEPASYVLLASAFGYADKTVGARGGDGIPVAAGEWVRDVRVTMTPLGSISGMVTDESGAPVADIPVRVVSSCPIAGRDRLVAGPITSTDDRGAYTVGALSAGTYFVMLPSVQSSLPADYRSPLGEPRAMQFGADRLVVGDYPVGPPRAGSAFSGYPALLYPSARSISEASSLVVRDGIAISGINFAVTPAQTASVSGAISGPSDAVLNLVLRLLPRGLEDLGIGSEQSTTLVRPDGSFTFIGVPLGSYTLVAERTVAEFVRNTPIALGLPQTPGLPVGPSTGLVVASAPSVVVARRLGQRPDTGYAARLGITVGEDGVRGLVVSLQKPNSLDGRLVFDGTTHAGRVAVSADPADGRPDLAGIGVPRGNAGAPDVFELDGLVPAQYFLRVASGAGWAVKSIVAEGVEYTDRPLPLDRADVHNIVVTLTDQVPALTGTVRDRQGAVRTDATVVAFPADRSLWRDWGLNPVRFRQSTTIRRGAYLISGLPAGEYELAAVALPDGATWLDPAFLETVAKEATHVPVRWGAATTVDLVLANLGSR